MKSSGILQLLLLLSCCWIPAINSPAVDSNSVPHFNIQGYLVNDSTFLPSTNLFPMLSAHTGTNIDLDEIVRAAADLQSEYARRGYPSVGIAVGEHEITNGIVTLHVFQSAVPQIRISGKRYTCASNEVALASNRLPSATPAAGFSPAATNTLAKKSKAMAARPPRPPTREQIALREKLAQLDLQDRIAALPPQPPPTVQVITRPPKYDNGSNVLWALSDKMTELDQQARRAELLPSPATNSVPSTNGPVFEVRGYQLIGNTLLPSDITELVLRPYIGTSVTFGRIRAALSDLQTVYREHGFATVSVTLPQQTLTDKIVKIRVFEGRLAEISIVNNRYFSSNNIMRALPSLHPNMILTAPVFQAELDRANANQDRQIYPKIEPGPIEGTSDLELDVKDRLPLHAKAEFNNENSPGTPELRVNSSAAYNNLWQLEHSLGLQYSFSPEKYKTADNWMFYDKPLVANYSGFYRLPLGVPEAVANTISSSTRFGYDEATRKFNLPPPSGQAELNIFASHSTIDTGLQEFAPTTLFDIPGVRNITMQKIQQDITINSAEGFQLTEPLPEIDGIRSTWAAIFNYKSYHITSSATNNFTIREYTVNQYGEPNPPTISTIASAVPLTDMQLDYLPIGLRYDGSRPDALGLTEFGLGLTVNAWYSGSTTNLHNLTGSTESSGHWVTLNPSLTRDFNLPKNWMLSAHAEGQWASEPLISNEQFGSGGVNSVRGYHEGEVFGDSGWRVDFDLKTPPHVAGIVYGKQPLTIRGSIFTDYSESYLIALGGDAGRIPLWSAGIGSVMTIGPHWESRLIFAVPFDRTEFTEPLRPRFNFSLTGQF